MDRGQAKNMKFDMAVLFLVVAACYLPLSEGRGRLIDPPARASMWRYGFKTPINYNDNGLNCGGASVEWVYNKGQCGVCGDSYGGRRDNEAGGIYALGVIGRKYTAGQTVTLKVEITANEQGWFEFNLCSHNDPKTPVKEECLNATLLQLASGGTRFQLPSFINGVVEIEVILPKNVTCTQCVLRWKWNAGNQWGQESDGTTCIGCGKQEQFYNCADISISPSNGSVAARTTPSSTSTFSTTTVATMTTAPTTTAATTEDTTATMSSSSQSTSSLQSQTPVDLNQSCFAVNTWAGDSVLDHWCDVNCKQLNNCPPEFCLCVARAVIG